MLVFHEVAYSNLTEAKHFKPRGQAYSVKMHECQEHPIVNYSSPEPPRYLYIYILQSGALASRQLNEQKEVPVLQQDNQVQKSKAWHGLIKKRFFDCESLLLLKQKGKEKKRKERKKQNFDSGNWKKKKKSWFCFFLLFCPPALFYLLYINPIFPFNGVERERER